MPDAVAASDFVTDDISEEAPLLADADAAEVDLAFFLPPPLFFLPPMTFGRVVRGRPGARVYANPRWASSDPKHREFPPNSTGKWAGRHDE